MIRLRPAQEEIIKYQSGTMGIAAVPGSGKTWTLSQVAVSLIASGALQSREEVLIVTLVNSAVDNFRHRVSEILKERGLIPGLGYRVRTLHSLAHEIVSQSTSLVGLSSDFSVVDERVAETIMKTAFQASYTVHQESLMPYLVDDLSDYRRRRAVANDLPSSLEKVTKNAISHLKGRLVSPQLAREKLSVDCPVLARLAVDVFERYERSLATRGVLDFDDLVSSAVRALDLDETLASSLREKWPYVLEDEAQDSSALQEQILRRIVGEGGNWVRVGDPNQAIYETFTTANPKYLRDFLEEADVAHDLPNSGRSGRPIIGLANELIRWAQDEHPVHEVRNSLSLPLIQVTPEGDPQPNPADDQCRVGFDDLNTEPGQELQRVIASVNRWLPEHSGATVAILVPTNTVGGEVVKTLKDEGIPYCDALLRTATPTKEAAGALSIVLRHLAHPEESNTILPLYKVWYHRVLKKELTEEVAKRLEIHLKVLQQWRQSEDLLWPLPGTADLQDIPDDVAAYFERFREQVQRWQSLVSLPITEILNAVAQDLFDEPEKLALTQLFGEILRNRSQYILGVNRRMVTLEELVPELIVIAKDQRHLRSIESDSNGFDPKEHKGEVIVSTMHGAKGLEWDRVYLMSVNDYDFPAGLSEDYFRSEGWFVRDKLSIEAETIAQLDAALDGHEYVEGRATQASRFDYARERLRLLYVSITRAQKELMVTTNVGRFGRNKPALAFRALQSYALRDING